MKKLKILMCCHFIVKSDLGGPKGYIEVADTYRRLGHEVTIVGVKEIVGRDDKAAWEMENFSEHLKNYILAHHNQYDVIEYEALYLPYDLKNEVKSILVARSVLLELHFLNIKLPPLRTLRSIAGHWLKKYKRFSELRNKIKTFLLAMKYADVVNVSNPEDQKILIAHGIPAEKIVMQPYGIYEKRFREFQIEKKSSSSPVIAFVGSFDRRKGAVEFPYIIRKVAKEFPDVKFRLMGVLGLFSTGEKIRKYLGKSLQPHVEVVERFRPEALPELLSDCKLGIFPSHLESFGFGVLEMMSAELPVIGYDAPGTNMLLPSELLVGIGDKKAMTERIITLLKDQKKRDEYAKICLERASTYIYEKQENHSIERYLQLLDHRD